jgi:phenylpropionate dioxygenase-like ring-hydroxylating dioxygenase large terminal subunit
MDGRTDPDILISALADAATAEPDMARAMPGAYYTSPDLLALETTHLFKSEWICVGRVDEIPSPGDFLTYDILDEPVAVVRDADGTLRAMSNVCRHRAAPLLDGTGNARRIVCPYHAWTYDLAGQLIGAPHIPARADFDKADCRLPQYACETWQGFVFVNLDPAAPPLGPTLSDLDARIANYHFDELRTRYTTWEISQTNWKSLVENFMEGYHLSPLHKETLHPVNPTELCAHFPPGDAFFGYTVGFSPDMERAPRGHPDLSPKERDTCVMFCIPPNLMVGGGSDYSSFLCIEPFDTTSVRVKMGLFFYGDDWTDDEIDTAVSLFHDTMEEDKLVLDRIGRGLAAPSYAPGPLAPAAFEGCIHDLQKYIANRLGHLLADLSAN